MNKLYKLTFAGEEIPDYSYRGSGGKDDSLAGWIVTKPGTAPFSAS